MLCIASDRREYLEISLRLDETAGQLNMRVAETIMTAHVHSVIFISKSRNLLEGKLCRPKKCFYDRNAYSQYLNSIELVP